MAGDTGLEPHRGILRRYHFNRITGLIRVVALVLVGIAGATAQAAPNTPQDFKPSPELLNAMGRLFQKMQREVQLPPVRSQSSLLPLLPEFTTFYAAFPNYGEAVHQALAIFHKGLEQDDDLRAWWQQVQPTVGGPQIEEYLEKYSALSQYLGDEVVLAAALDEKKEPAFLIITEVRKPGTKEFLVQMAKELKGQSQLAMRIYAPQELAAARENHGEQKLSILVRPGFVVGAFDVASLRRFNALLDKNGQSFASTPFGQRVTQAYEGGTTAVGAINFQKLLALSPTGSKQDTMMLERSGFADAKYLVWQHTSTPGRAASQMELSFTGPRRGIASWLAAPGPMGSLDFVSANAMITVAALLKNPAEIFDDISELTSASNPNALDGLFKMEAALKVNLRADLLSQLSGEIALEVDALEPNPTWRAILRVNDPQRLQATLDTMIAAMQVSVKRVDDGEITYRTFEVPSAQKMTEVGYAFADGYWIIASSREAVAKAIRLHNAGESLAKSKKFQAALPPPPLAEVSGVLYEDAGAMMAFNLKRAVPQMADVLSQTSMEKTPIVMCAYGEERALREASSSGGVDVGAVLVGAAIAIPNLLRARIAANESAAVSSIRSINTAQVAYSTLYTDRGYAPDLATLGPDPKNATSSSRERAGFIGATLGDAICISGAWCTNSGYQFTLKSICNGQKCREYVVAGTPESYQAGSKNYCSTSDAVIRFRIGPRLTAPVSASECRTWAPLP